MVPSTGGVGSANERKGPPVPGIKNVPKFGSSIPVLFSAVKKPEVTTVTAWPEKGNSPRLYVPKISVVKLFVTSIKGKSKAGTSPPSKGKFRGRPSGRSAVASPTPG